MSDPKPLLNASGDLLTCVETYFPPGSGVLLLRRDNDNLDIQLVRVDDTGALVTIAGKPLQYQQRPIEPDLVHRKTVQAEGNDHSVAGGQGRGDLAHRANQAVKRLPAHILKRIGWLWTRGNPVGHSDQCFTRSIDHKRGGAR